MEFLIFHIKVLSNKKYKIIYMKKVKLFIGVAIVISVLFLACNEKNNSADPNSNSNAVTKSTSSDAVSSGKASFSANIDGEAISGDKIDEMQLKNTAFIYPVPDKTDKRLLFELYSDLKGKNGYFFRFSVPDKTGSFTKNIHDGQPFDITIELIGDSAKGYSAQSVTLIITSITASRIAGTFAGEFIISEDSDTETRKKIAVTDGKFDIPFSTGNVRPE
jgi:hypothetical protein